MSDDVNYEEEARKDHWVPKEEFRGNPEDWVDAKTFVERGKQFNAILRSNNERLKKELELQNKKMDSLRATTEEFKKFLEEQTQKKVSQYEQEIKQLREEKRKAISSGDGDRVVDLEEQIDALTEERAAVKAEAKKTTTVEPQQQIAPEVQDWIDANSWYVTNTGMQQVANYEAEQLHLSRPDLTGKDFFDELDHLLEEKFSPKALGKEKTRKPRNPVEGGRGAGASFSGEKTYNDLPPEAKQACDRYVKEGLFKSREEYVARYVFDE